MKKLRNLLSVLFLLMAALLFLADAAFAFRNVCPVCKTVNDVELEFCSGCHRAMNQCLDCGQINRIKADVCAGCSATLAEMRSLGKIDPEIRSDLRLGETERSQLQRQIGRIENQLRLNMGNPEYLLFRKAQTFLALKNWGRAVQSYYEFQKAFPQSEMIETSRISLSLALCKVGWMRYESGNAEQALEKFTEAAEVDPRNGNAWRLIGQMNIALEDPKAATIAYQKALALDPGDAEAKSALLQIKRANRPSPSLEPAPKKTRKKIIKGNGKK